MLNEKLVNYLCSDEFRSYVVKINSNSPIVTSVVLEKMVVSAFKAGANAACKELNSKLGGI